MKGNFNTNFLDSIYIVKENESLGSTANDYFNHI